MAPCAMPGLTTAAVPNTSSLISPSPLFNLLPGEMSLTIMMTLTTIKIHLKTMTGYTALKASVTRLKKSSNKSKA